MRNKLIALMLAGTIATTPIAFAGCSDSAETENLTVSVATDAKLDISRCVYVYPENSTKDYFVSIIGHYDNGENRTVRYSHLQSYYDHKDYRITYKVSQEDYAKILKLSTKTIAALSQEEISVVESIVSTYDPVEVKDLQVKEESLHDKFEESFRFSEEDLTAE